MPTIQIKSSKTQITLKDLVKKVISNFKDNYFSLHDITKACRDLEHQYKIEGLTLSADPISHKMVQWMKHSDIKILALKMIKNGYFQEKFDKVYRTYKNLNNSPQTAQTTPIAKTSLKQPLKPLVFNKSLENQLKTYLQKRKSKNLTTTLKQIQSRFKRNPMSVSEIESLCLKAGIKISTNSSYKSKRTANY